MSSAPGCEVVRPAADGRESRQPEAESKHEVPSPRNQDKNSGGGQARPEGLEAVEGEGRESREGAGAGRERSGAEYIRSKRDQKARLLIW